MDKRKNRLLKSLSYKRCSVCKDDFPESRDWFYTVEQNGRVYFKSECINCYLEIRRSTRKKEKRIEYEWCDWNSSSIFCL